MGDRRDFRFDLCLRGGRVGGGGGYKGTITFWSICRYKHAFLIKFDCCTKRYVYEDEHNSLSSTFCDVCSNIKDASFDGRKETQKTHDDLCPSLI